MLPYEPRVKLLNNGNVVGLRFGFRAVSCPNLGSPGRGFESGIFFPNLDGTSSFIADTVGWWKNIMLA